MGQVISVLTKGIDAIADGIGKTVSDVGTTVNQLQNIAKQMETTAQLNRALQLQSSALATHALRRLSLPIIIFAGQGGATDFNVALKAAMTGAKSASLNLFKAQFSSIDPAGTDSGVVNGFRQNGDLSSVKQQMSNDFTNWNIPTINDPVSKMASTIQIQMQSQIGMGGTSYGTTYLNVNQSIVWTVAYGEFAVTADSNGLVYAFTAGLESGFSAYL